MNKEKFLSELREYLSVLENQEQEDILAEYAQHIDMKMQKGLSEEEAIRDFGAIEELAAEILDAYHVNPEFRRKGIVFRIPKPRADMRRNFTSLRAGAVRSIPGTKADTGYHSSNPKAGMADNSLNLEADDNFGLFSPEADGINGGGGFWRWAGRRIKEALTGALRKIGHGFCWLGSKCRAFAGWCSKPFTRRKGKTGEGVQESRMERKGTKEMDGRMGKFFRVIGQGIVMAWRWFAGLCLFCMKFMWNAAWLLFGIFCACMAMVVLMGVGAIPVLLAQGYPFLGIFMICLGGLLCLGSLTFGAFSLLIRKKDDTGDDGSNRYGKDEMAEKSDKEEAYEQTA